MAADRTAVAAGLETGGRVEPEHLEPFRRAEQERQVGILRELFSNPFRPVSIDPSWLTPDARLLAQGIDDEAAFDRMPLLAAALQDAGCDSEEVLNHCRQGDGHFRGCWVIDLVLGKG